ncbi:MAG: F0F1 ATP synthase subunit delta [Chloroflexota bacterium]|nr:F0F1 ATP synthase subunit delta [Chloroflexota bacterium]
MALRGGAARRYAAAVVDLAKSNNSLDKWLSDLKVLNGIFGTPNAVAALDNPRLPEAGQREIMASLVPEGIVSPLAMNLLLMLVHRQRLALLPRIVEIYGEMYNKEKGIVVAQVTTAVRLDDEHKALVQQQLERITGKSVELRVHEDPSILGGIITQIGDQLLDASIATRLAEMAERLS